MATNSYSNVVTALGGQAVLPDSIRGVAIVKPKITDFTVTASGTVVTPSAISVSYALATLTVPSTDQPVEYSVSYRGGDPVVANIQASSTAPINVKVGQNFNVIASRAGNPEYDWTYVPNNNNPITLIKQTGVPIGPPGVIGLGGTLISTFQATQTGSYKVQYTNIGESKTIDYVINVN